MVDKYNHDTKKNLLDVFKNPNGGSQFTTNLTVDKLKKARKENIKLKNRNKELNSELISLQTNIRQMFPGYSTSKVMPFPLMTDLLIEINTFIENDCFEIYKLLFDQSYSLHDLLFFYRKVFDSASGFINQYFNPLSKILKGTLQMEQLCGPLDCVLRRSYQVDWEKLLSHIMNDNNYDLVINSIQKELDMDAQTQEAYCQMENFLEETTEVLFKCYISDPSLVFDFNQIARQVAMDVSRFDCFDSRLPIKSNANCVIAIPCVYKVVNDQAVVVINPKVLPSNL